MFASQIFRLRFAALKMTSKGGCHDQDDTGSWPSFSVLRFHSTPIESVHALSVANRIGYF